MPENTRYKLSQTVTKIVNKGSNNLIAIVLWFDIYTIIC
jgi:hypothetical protein